MENIYQTIRGRTKSPRTLESNSKDPLSAAKPLMRDVVVVCCDGAGTARALCCARKRRKSADS